MRGYRVLCFLADGSEQSVTIKASSDTEAISEARVVLFSQKAVAYQVVSVTRKARKEAHEVIFDWRKAGYA